MPLLEIALTFDDGPNPPFTEQILDILKQHSITAAFFVIGKNVLRHPETVKRMAREGHLVGSHTHNHHFFRGVAGLSYREFIDTQDLIDKIAPQEQKIFRSPWGVLPFWVSRRLKREGYKDLSYRLGKDVKSYDWTRFTDKERIVRLTVSGLKPGAMIFLHDGYLANAGIDTSKVVTALPEIIKQAKARGYTFVKPTKLFG